MTEFTFQTEINASPEEIWEMYANVANRFKWEFDLEEINLQGDFVTGACGTIKLEGQPAMPFTLLSVIPYREILDQTEIPGTGMAICVNHTLIPHGKQTLVRHSMSLQKKDGAITETDIKFLQQIFTDTPQAILAIKKEVESNHVSL